MFIHSKNGRIIACGTLSRNVEFRRVRPKQLSLCKFSIKAAEIKLGGNEKETKWLNCVCWHKLAHYAANLEKGDTVLVCGVLKDASYTNKNNVFVKRTELECEFVLAQPVPSEAQPASDFIEADDDDDIPF